MIYLKNMEKSEEALIEKLYTEAFPEVERKPFSMLLRLRKKNKADLWVIHDSHTEEAVGLAFMLLYRNQVLFDYFAIMKEHRSKGYGKSVLEALADKYAGKALFGEVEPLDVEADNYEQRVRRMNFYMENGFHQTGIYVNLFGCVLQLIYMGETAVTYEEYIKFLKHAFGLFGPYIISKNVSLVKITQEGK